MSRFVPLERSTLHSPAWFIPFDDYARRVRGAGVTVQLDRYEDGDWLPLDDLAVRTPSAAFAYPGLGRCAEPWAARPRRHRARFAAVGYQPLYPADGQPFSAALVGVEFLVHPYDDAHPPPAVTEPRLVRLLPGVSFPYPPGLRTVHGAVVDAATRSPIAGALVEATGRTGRDLTPWHERTLTDAAGAFRLALRWEGEKADEHAIEETFRLQATERPGRSGSLVVRLPQDIERRHVIEIRES
ncbi:carboxypeptidase-like regulatory domain-containing protein [Streptomyces sp. PSAA01]|uniref:carboxypeptidase-like regulatory domain-containing protein n=1 Tax=Streptomyces sp. PSAA01 TaxID=2912762 RepID=UPI001F1E6C38|nr:carboxypeptidase-like regulatory domain-containing protein [Streptomyces sp. PSAA01]MCG0288564.1 carboxypeptidase-like regulatory domain-containing protein [Streptomyces sp. PSAA01]